MEFFVQRDSISNFTWYRKWGFCICLTDNFQIITDLDLFTTSASVFHHFICEEQDFLSHFGGNLALHPSDNAGSPCHLLPSAQRLTGPKGLIVPVWLFANLPACFPTACQQVTLPAVQRCRWSFRCRKENNSTLQANLSLLTDVKQAEQQHTASAKPRAFRGTEKAKTQRSMGVFKKDV